jgi:hypothetical protein
MKILIGLVLFGVGGLCWWAVIHDWRIYGTTSPLAIAGGIALVFLGTIVLSGVIGSGDSRSRVVVATADQPQVLLPTKMGVIPAPQKEALPGQAKAPTSSQEPQPGPGMRETQLWQEAKARERAARARKARARRTLQATRRAKARKVRAKHRAKARAKAKRLARARRAQARHARWRRRVRARRMRRSVQYQAPPPVVSRPAPVQPAPVIRRPARRPHRRPNRRRARPVVPYQPPVVSSRPAPVQPAPVIRRPARRPHKPQTWTGLGG